MVNPHPQILIDGQFLDCAVTQDDAGATVLYSDRATLIGRMSIEWGRADQWTQPDPAVLTLTIWEPQPGTWLTKIIEKRAMRRGCLISYTHQDGEPRTIFQGFTTNVDVHASRQRTDVGTIDGWLVTIQCTDRSGFLGQIDWYSGELPTETMQQRAVRIRNQGASVGIRQVYFEDRFKDGAVNPVKVTDKTVLDTVNELYRSFADQWTYEQHRNTIIRIPSGSNWGGMFLRFGVGTGDGVSDRSIGLFPPDMADPTGHESPIDEAQYQGASIPGCAVTGNIVLSSTLIQAITKVSCKWTNGGVDTTTSRIIKADDPPALLEFESWYSTQPFIDGVLDSAVDMCAGDGAKPTHPQIRWDTSKTGDIGDWSTFESLTLPSQTIRLVTLTGSPFSAAIGDMPIWHPMGGVVAYEAGKWDITMNLAPTTPPLPADFEAVTCETVHESITLADPDRWHLDPSITCFDLQFVGDGLVYSK